MCLLIFSVCFDFCLVYLFKMHISCGRSRKLGFLPVILPMEPFKLAPTKPDMWAPRLTPIMWMELRETPCF